MQGIKRRSIRISIAVTAAVALLGTAFAVGHAVAASPDRAEAPAADVVFTGKGVVAAKVATSNGLSSSTSQTFTAIPGASTTISVPSGTSRLVVATFGAESSCSGSGTGICVVKLVARKTTSTAVSEMDPTQGGSGIFFDFNADPDGPCCKALSITRAKYLSAGTWQISALRKTTNSTTASSLAGPVLRVDVYAR